MDIETKRSLAFSILDEVYVKFIECNEPFTPNDVISVLDSIILSIKVAANFTTIKTENEVFH